MGNRQTCQMTSGVASFLLLTPKKVVGQSVPCTKKHNQWIDFAAKNSVLLQDLAGYQSVQWKEYDNPADGSRWYFNLRGYFHFDQDAVSVQKRRWPRRRADTEEDVIIHV